MESSNKYGLEAVKRLPGVGETTLKKLIKSGFYSLKLIAVTAPSVIMELAGLGEKTTSKLIKSSMDQLGIKVEKASAIYKISKDSPRLTTNSQDLDNIIGGGLPTGSITEFFGEYRTGKTQIAHQLCVNVQISKEKGGLEGKALYIDTEGSFNPIRIKQMAEAMDLDSNTTLNNIIVGYAINSAHQLKLLREAASQIYENNIKILIIDNIINHFRAEYIGKGTQAIRQRTLAFHLNHFRVLVDAFNLVGVFTNQVATKPDVFYGTPIRATGGNIVAHTATNRFYLRKGKGEQRIAKLIKSPCFPEKEAIFSITEDGIRD